jgi:hypothetical protein
VIWPEVMVPLELVILKWRFVRWMKMDEMTLPWERPKCSGMSCFVFGFCLNFVVFSEVENQCEFKSSIEFEFLFEKPYPLRFIVFDASENAKKAPVLKQLGTADMNLADIIAAPGNSLRKTLLNEKKVACGNSSIVVRVSAKHTKENRVLRVEFAGKGLASKDFLGKSDPFFELHKIEEDNKTTLIYTSEVIKQNLNPTWDAADAFISKLADGELDKPFLIKVFDWDSQTANDLIGQCTATVNEVLNVDTFNKELKNLKGKLQGRLTCVKSDLMNDPSILDFLLGGCFFEYAIAIDFTGSNGDPRQPDTLHHKKKGKMNLYQKAIQSFGTVLVPQDSDQKIAALGFVSSFQSYQF